MKVFDSFVLRVREALAKRPDIRITVDRPKMTAGLWFLTLVRDDGFMIEVEWHRNRGFGIAAGHELAFGSGVDEIYGSPEAAHERISNLIESGEPTSIAEPVNLADLRKLRGVLQKDVAQRLRITKSGLAQLESASLESMQIATLNKVVTSLGGELVLTARFPEGHERQISID